MKQGVNLSNICRVPCPTCEGSLAVFLGSFVRTTCYHCGESIVIKLVEGKEAIFVAEKKKENGNMMGQPPELAADVDSTIPLDERNTMDISKRDALPKRQLTEAPKEIEKIHPDIDTEKKLVSEIEVIQRVIAKAIQDHKPANYAYGPEIVSAMLSSVEHILASSGIDPQSTLRMGVLIARKEIWETCHEQYKLKKGDEDAG